MLAGSTKVFSLATLLLIATVVGTANAIAHDGVNHSRPDPNAIPAESLSTLMHEISLYDQRGRPFTLVDLKGRPVLLNFMYTECIDVCGLQTFQLRELQLLLEDLPSGNQPLLLSISLDPEKDTSAQLLEYATRFSADADFWWFASGLKFDVDRLASALWIGQQNRQDGEIDHRMILHLFNKDLEPIQRYQANPVDVERLFTELKSLAAL